MSNIDIQQLRNKTVKAIAQKIVLLPNELTSEDYALDTFYRQLAKLPPLPTASYPLVGFFSTTKPIAPLFAKQAISEEQVTVNNYLYVDCSVLGKLAVTGGFMEDHGHSRKQACQAIFADGKIRDLPPSNRNLGVDYCCDQIRAWYDGTCYQVGNERGYGNRAYFTWDVKYFYQGSAYQVYGAFAHASKFIVNKGEKVGQGQLVGYQGATGGNYAPHIDYRQWIYVDGKLIDLSPNALEKQLHG